MLFLINTVTDHRERCHQPSVIKTLFHFTFITEQPYTLIYGWEVSKDVSFLFNAMQELCFNKNIMSEAGEKHRDTGKSA